VKIVIQCAAKKRPDAGYLANSNGTRILFVADPENAPLYKDTLYARPDDIAEDGKTWRELLLDYNKLEDNPLELSPAYKLYMNSTYQMLVDRYGVNNVFILSAGWGLIDAAFLTPKYDITFSPSADAYKRRRKRDHYNDLCMLRADSDDDLVFFGGKDYLPLFCKLTQNYLGNRFVFYNSAIQPNTPGCTLIRYRTSTRTNWHYGCAKDFIAGEIGIHAPS